jgi:eukaryotic-like serine/threonine-protein kinase
VDAQIPAALSRIVSKCLERDLRTERYQTVSEVLADLNTWKDREPAGSNPRLDAKRCQTLGTNSFRGRWWGDSDGGSTSGHRFFASRPIFRPSASSSVGGMSSAPAVSLAILPFPQCFGRSKPGLARSSLADMLSTDVGQSSQLRTVSPAVCTRYLPTCAFPPLLCWTRRLSAAWLNFSNADRVVWGQYAKFGDQIRIDATLQDIKSGPHISAEGRYPERKRDARRD